MMRYINTWCIVLVFVFGFFCTGCLDTESRSNSGNGDSDDSYSMSNLPNDYRVDIPDSLKSASKKRSGGSDFKGMGYETVSMFVLISEIELYVIEMDMMLIDSVFGQLVANSGEQVVQAEFTQAMADKMKEMETTMSDDFSSEESAEAAADRETRKTRSNNDSIIDEMVGQIFPVTVEYQTGVDEVYEHYVRFTGIMGGAMESDDAGEEEFRSDSSEEDFEEVIKWSDDKTKVSVTYLYPDGDMQITYDDSRKIMTMMFAYGLGGGETTREVITIQEKDNGVYIKLTSEGMNIEGFADDNGGYYVMTFDMGFGESMTYRETFDANGNVTSVDESYSDMYTEAFGSISIDEVTVEVSASVGIHGSCDFYLLPAGTVYNPDNDIAFFEKILAYGVFNETGSASDFCDVWVDESALDDAVVWYLDSETFEPIMLDQATVVIN